MAKSLKRSITLPRGFRAAATTCGIKPSGKPDMSLILAESLCAAAAVFTKNRLPGAPVIAGKRHLRNGQAQAIVINSGIANSSGVLGRYLMDQFYIGQSVQAVVPEARDGKAPRGLMGGGGYIPRFRNLKGQPQRKDYIRGYAVEFYAGRTPDAKYLPSYGEQLEKDLASVRGAGVSFTTMGDVLPRYENHVRIDDSVVDAWGIPALRFSARYGDNEFHMAKDAIDTLEELCEASGFEVLGKHDKMYAPGRSIHELGTCRMGDDPKKSVLNKWNQSHDIKNVFVVDGSSFVTAGSQNPTITILALAMRASEYLAEELRAGNL